MKTKISSVDADMGQLNVSFTVGCTTTVENCPAYPLKLDIHIHDEPAIPPLSICPTVLCAYVL